VEPGETLAGKYRIERVLGKGGMGIVVKAMHLHLHQPVAVKFLLPEVARNRDLVARFLREAQSAVRLQSEHVARVLDVGTLPTGAPYMVLEYLDGSDLAHLPRSHLSTGSIVDMILQACEALAEAHSVGIIHRDIKPANFFVARRRDGSVLLKILDFGISKASGPQQINLTATQGLMGTPAYMSPEQMKSASNVDPRSDIWSLGVVLYELLEGHLPYTADSFAMLYMKVTTEPPRPFTARVPDALRDIALRCIERDPARRFRDVGELAKALAPFARSTTQAAVSVERTSRITMPGGGAGTMVTMMETAADTPTTLGASVAVLAPPPPPAKRRWPWFAGAGAFAALVSFVIVMATRSGGDSPSPEPAAAPPSSPSPSPSPSPAAVPAPSPAAVPAAAVPAPAPVAVPAPAPAPATVPARAPASKPKPPVTPKPKQSPPTTAPGSAAPQPPPPTKPPPTKPSSPDILDPRT
jgi:serine/threonine protein kinase